MEDKKPVPKQPTPTAETIFRDPPKTIRATVRVNNRYGDHFAGAVVEVTEREYQRVKHALVSEADERAEKAAAIEASKPADDAGMFRAFRHRFRAANAQRKTAQDERKRQEIAAIMGATPKAAG